MLYIIATPIGNLEDITLRALRLLKEVNYVLAEDTRHTQKLLHHFEIGVKLVSLHKFNERSRLAKIIDDLQAGKKIGLVTDAGMPCVSDPGVVLIKEVRKCGLPLTCLPGASAPVTALALSGIEKDHFQFLGFFPTKASDAKKAALDAETYDGVSLFFESPRRLLKTLEQFHEDTPLTVARELTKIHEEVISGDKKTLIAHFKQKEVKGEIVLLIEGKPATTSFSSAFEEKLMGVLAEFVSHSDAAKILGKVTGKGKKSFY